MNFCIENQQHVFSKSVEIGEPCQCGDTIWTPLDELNLIFSKAAEETFDYVPDDVLEFLGEWHPDEEEILEDLYNDMTIDPYTGEIIISEEWEV